MVTDHVDSLTRDKIRGGEFVDFSRLVPRDKMLVEEDQRMEMVNRNGLTYWVPIRDSSNINSFAKWEQAFRVFWNVYTEKFP